MLAHRKDRAVSRHVSWFLSLAPCLLAAPSVLVLGGPRTFVVSASLDF